nr:MAG TPA: hypothetical protein [Caudoviricetes sp.]
MLVKKTTSIKKIPPLDKIVSTKTLICSIFFCLP